MTNGHAHHHHPETGAKGLVAYTPLLVVITTALLGSLALQMAGISFMHAFMGLFFLLFAMFKFFDLNGFADGFQTYDLIAGRLRAYALAYPFAELALGLAYLSHWQPQLTNLITLILMSVSAAGVMRSLASGRKITCACLGTLLKVPLSTVSVVENLGMGVMAAAMLLI